MSDHHHGSGGEKNENKNTSTITLPVVNISNITSDAGQQLLGALVKYGFVYIDTYGTDFTSAVIERQFELSRRFFNSPADEKEACKIGPDNKGWLGMRAETLDPAHHKRGDFKEAFNFGEFINDQPQQPIPRCLQGDEPKVFDFETRCRETCHQVFKLLALGLEIPDLDWFSSRHTTPSRSTLRFLRYPALSEDTDCQPEVDIRAGAHSDYGSITLLFQRSGQPGLEIQTSDKKWSPVPVIPTGYDPRSNNSSDNEAKDRAPPPLPPILLNIGDCFSYWTNGLLLSTVHRVVFPHSSSSSSNTKDRYSIAYFSQPCDDVPLEAVPSRVVAERPLVDRVGYGDGAGGDENNSDNGVGVGVGGGKIITSKEHLIKRLGATYDFKPE